MIIGERNNDELAIRRKIKKSFMLEIVLYYDNPTNNVGFHWINETGNTLHSYVAYTFDHISLYIRDYMGQEG